jgi:tetratricopeptide (TPR) repeat protein
MLHSSGDHHNAIKLYSEVLESQTHQLGAYHPDTIMTAANYANICKSLGDIAKAEALYTQALEGFYLIRESACMSWLRTSRHLGDLYEAEGRITEAIEVRQRCIEKAIGYDESSGKESLLIIRQLASNLFGCDNIDDAIELAIFLKNRIEEDLGFGNTLVPQLLELQIEFLERAGRYDEVALCREQALECHPKADRAHKD